MPTADIAASVDEGTSTGSGTDAWARFSSCAEVAPLVAQYIEGLQEAESNSVGEYGVNCEWATPDDATDLRQVRSVEVLVGPGPGEVPAARDLESVGLVVLPDAGVEEAGGVAYTMDTMTSIIGVIVTTVTTPDVEVTIGGGQWDDVPALDGPAAVSVAKQLIGVGA